MEQNEKLEDLFLTEEELKQSLINILPKVKGDMNDEETLKFAYGVKIQDFKTKADLKKAKSTENKRLKDLSLVLNRILKSNRNIFSFDDTVKVMKTEFFAPVQELYDYDGKLIIRSPRIEMGFSGAYYYYDVRSNEFVSIHYNEKTKVVTEISRKTTENDLLLEFEKKDKGRRFGFSKVPNIPTEFEYDTEDEQGS